jgi:hypothetical protein
MKSRMLIAGRAWERFWFAPESTSTLAVVRAVWGFTTFWWTLSCIPDLKDFFSSSGVLPDAPRLPAGAWGVLGIFPSDAVLTGLLFAMLVASLCVMVGYHTRLATAIVFVGLLSLERRDPFVFNSGDVLLRVEGFYLLLAPAGAALSYDARFRAHQAWEFPRRAPWALRLIQVQFSVVYLSTVWAKLRGVHWNDGTAASYALRLTDLERFPVPHLFASSAIVSNLVTYGTLAIELSVGLLVWNRKLRPWVLMAGLGLHLGIEYAIRVGFFTLALCVAYLAWVPPQTMDRVLVRLRDGLGALRLSLMRRARQQAR